ncbi:MAG: hypothetical protein J6K42_00520 [Clostridia bacterium]|nr:hypothetical protein [Clostridia bacterium]
MQCTSSYGTLIISVSDTAKVHPLDKPIDYKEYAEVVDVNLKAVEGIDITWFDVADAMCDCFPHLRNTGLNLLTKSIMVHLTVGKKKYNFRIYYGGSKQAYLNQIVFANKL